MIARKILLVAAAAALTTTPAWALPSQAPSNQGTAHAPTTPTTPTGDHGTAPSHPGPGSHPSHKCMAHKVAYVASGLLVSQTLSQDGSTYSGDVTVDVKRTNHHAMGDKGKTVTYTVSNARIKFALADVNADGTAGLDDLQAGDRVQLIGKVTALAKKCDQTGFTAATTIRRIVFHGPVAPAS